MKTKSKKVSVKMLTESAIMIALATVLSFIKLWDFPAGGSITIASMFPIAVIAFRYGTPWGIFTAIVYGIVQQLVGLSTLSYVTTWQSVVAVVLLDYIVAFAVIGLAGIFRKKIRRPSTALIMGSLLACVLRYLCHVISGVTVWAGLSIPDEAALLYSISYNATYMLPETTVWMLPCAGLTALAALVYDIVAIFGRLQNEDGVFDLSGIASVNWLVFAIINAVAAIVILTLIIIYKVKQKKAAN